MLTFLKVGAAGMVATIMSLATMSEATAQGSILRAVLGESNQKTAEVSTEDVRRILADGSAICWTRASAPNMSPAISPARKT
jgi:hypothetical protein